jgi:hypothetical protein
MTEEQFKAIYPQVYEWIRQTLFSSVAKARTVDSAGFSRLPLYFSLELLSTTKFVVVDQVPVPPLSAMGLKQFADFERGNWDGITYLDTFFVRRSRASDERLYFHELIHVLQWHLLGPERFLAAYADGLETLGYHKSPLEIMAYDAENAFVTVAQPFDAEKHVKDQLKIKDHLRK